MIVVVVVVVVVVLSVLFVAIAGRVLLRVEMVAVVEVGDEIAVGRGEEEHFVIDADAEAAEERDEQA